MEILKLKETKALSKTEQKSIVAGGIDWDHPICCYKACVNSGNPSELCRDICFL